MSAPENWPAHGSSAEQAQQGPPQSQMAQGGPPQGPHRPPIQYQTPVQGQAGPVLPPPSTLPTGPAGYYQSQHPIPLPVMPPHGREPYPMAGPIGPSQGGRASLPPQGASAAESGPPQAQAPPPQGQSAAPTGMPPGMSPQNQLAQGPIPPQSAQVPQPVHPQTSPPMARSQPQMASLNAASAASAHHSLAALAGPQMQMTPQKGGPQMNAGQPQPQQAGGGPPNGPVGPILNDALSYLDQVKYQFHDRPDVYNQFLDIMKDFKSQAIDTPGVIKRVSTLFSGHPNLVQGFNTFLPPGFIISCSNDPMDNSIRVTTPQGTTTAQATGPPRQINAPRDVSQFYEMPRGAKWPANAQEGMYGPYIGQGGPAGERAHHEARMREIQQQEAARAQAALVQNQAHHANVQAVNQLQNAAAATNGAPRPGPMGPGVVVTPTTAERQNKGPVEFNHAISYVNKIKNRFAAQPEIYKNFLEILQTYQREQKPIQDVYSQVTELFKSAPDLLEEFKQFLPESAAQAKAAAAAKAAAEEAAQNSLNQNAMDITGGPSRLPPVGNFAPPPSASKEKKKRAQTNGADAAREFPQQPTRATGAAAHKAPQRSKAAQKPTETVPLSPTLTPYKPEPYLASSQGQPTSEDLAFFDRAKKFIGNKQTYNEFLKLLNLFTQELIDKNTLVAKIENFIGGNKDLMEWFKKFIHYEGTDEVVNNLPLTLNKVRLSVCRAYGPSYRLLPRAEAQKPCSGRDEMCREVLNDDWASHPTWASEDSGFVAHRKNQYEDVLHRIEEERHDYDFNIEANLRTIQLLEPIAQKIANLTPEERANFKLMPGLEGQSKTIYKRVIKKIYEKDRGNEVIEQLHNNPCVVVPIVLRRLKQKDEEWKMAQREWNKVWREQTQKAFWKSLDHHGLSVKISDRKNYMLKNLVSELQTKHKEQMMRRLNPLAPLPEYQYKYRIDDTDVLLDAVKLLTTALDHSSAHSAADKEKMEGFIHSFIPLFFGINPKELDERVSVSGGTPDEDGDVDQPVRRRPHLHRDENLLKSVFRRKTGRGHYRRDKEGSVASGSKESTPEFHSAGDEDTNMEGSEPETGSSIVTWIRPPKRYLPGEEAPKERSVSPGLPQRRTVFTLFCNNQTYGFFRTFHLLYSRLLDIKLCEADAERDIQNRKKATIAKELGILQNTPEDYFRNTEPGANYYKQVVEMCESFILGELEGSTFEDGLRQVYVQKGWQLYTIDKLLAAILKFIHGIVNSEKTGDAILLYQKDRKRTEFSPGKSEYMTLIDYRNKVENLFPSEEPLIKIDWDETTKDVMFQLLTKSDITVSTSASPEQKWNHYMQSYTMAIPTEGVADIRAPFLKRTIPRAPPTPSQTSTSTPHVLGSRASTPTSPTGTSTPAAGGVAPHTSGPFFWTPSSSTHLHPDSQTGGAQHLITNTHVTQGDISIENMEVKICVNSYKMFFSCYDILIRSPLVRRETPKAVVEARRNRWRNWLERVTGSGVSATDGASAGTTAGEAVEGAETEGDVDMDKPEEGAGAKEASAKEGQEVGMGDAGAAAATITAEAAGAEGQTHEEGEGDGDDTVLVEKEGDGNAEKDGDVEMKD